LIREFRVLEKLLSVENDHKEKVEKLTEADKEIKQQVTMLASETTKASNEMQENFAKREKDQGEVLETIKQAVTGNSSDILDLQRRVKNTENDIKNIDDTIDGLKNSLKECSKGQEELAKHVENNKVQINNVSIQVKEQEKNISEKNLSDNNLLKNQISDLENEVGLSRQKISEIDDGTQNLLEKLLTVENTVTEDVKSVKEKNDTIEKDFKTFVSKYETSSSEERTKLNSSLAVMKEDMRTEMTSLETNLKSLQNSVDEADKKHAVVGNENKKALDDLKGEFTAALSTITSSSMSSITSLTSKISSLDTNLENISKQSSANTNTIADIQKSQAATNAGLEDLKKDIKENTDHLKSVDDSIDGLKNLQQQEQMETKSRFASTDEEINKLKDTTTRQSQVLHTVEILNDKISNLEDKQPKLKSELERLESVIVTNTEKIVQIEEAHNIQVEKAKFIETLDAKVTQMDAMRQQSEAKAKEENSTSAKKLESDIADLKSQLNEHSKAVGVITPRLANLETDFTKTSDSVARNLEEISTKTDKTLENFKEEIQKSVSSLDVKINTLSGNVDNTDKENKAQFSEHNKKLGSILESHEQHSAVLTTMTNTIASIEESLSAYDSKQKAVTENLLVTSEAQLKEFRGKYDSRITDINRRIDEHNDQFDQTELNLVDMKRKFDENSLHAQRDMEEVKKKFGNENELVVMKIKEQKDTLESFFTSLEEKIELIETTQIKESSRVETIEKKTESIERSSLQLEKRIKEVERLGDDTSALWKQLSELQEYINISKEDLQSIRGYTVVLKSEGIVKKHQADVLGVYRMVDSYNERPVYKQDGGENYIYYRLDNLNEPIIQFLIQFHQQHLVCWNSCWSSVWVAEKFH